MSYSPQLTYFLDRLSGFSTNIFKLEPQGSKTATPNVLTRITLPANALLNTRSFKLFFRATTTGTGARLPADISTLVDRVEVSAGGVQLSQGTNFYNTLVNAKAAIQGSRCDSVTGHSEMVRAEKFDGTVVGATAGDNETYGSATESDGTHPHCIDKWEGFLGTCEPKILDAAILPDLVVTIYWASSTVLAKCKQNTSHALFTTAPATGSADYKIFDIHATIETIGLADAVYDNMVSSMIAQKGYLEIPFKQYFSFSNVHSGSSRFTVATQSLDRIWTAYRANAFDTQGPPVAVPGYGYRHFDRTPEIIQTKVAESGGTQGDITLAAHGFVVGQKLKYRLGVGGATAITNGAAALADGTDVFVQSAADANTFTIALASGGAKYVITNNGNDAQYFEFQHEQSKYRGVYGSHADKYISKVQKFEEPGSDLKYQLQLNGAYYPQFPASAEEMYQITKNSLMGPVKYDLTTEQLKNTNFVQCVRLNMPDSEFSRTISGLDTRSVSLNGYVNTSQGTLNSDPNLMIFAECTSCLRVGSGRQMEVVI